MKPVKLASLKQGEYFLRKPDAKKVYIRGEYNRGDKRYECYEFEDVNHFIYLKGEVEVYTEFEF